MFQDCCFGCRLLDLLIVHFLILILFGSGYEVQCLWDIGIFLCVDFVIHELWCLFVETIAKLGIDKKLQ